MTNARTDAINLTDYGIIGGTNQTARSGACNTIPEPDDRSEVSGKDAATMIAEPPISRIAPDGHPIFCPYCGEAFPLFAVDSEQILAIHTVVFHAYCAACAWGGEIRWVMDMDPDDPDWALDAPDGGQP